MHLSRRCETTWAFARQRVAARCLAQRAQRSMGADGAATQPSRGKHLNGLITRRVKAPRPPPTAPRIEWNTVTPAVAAARRALERRSSSVLLPIRGVSFDDRQDIVRSLRTSQGVMCEREPHNPHDANAVRISTLGGDHLGYVPREQTHLIRREWAFGNVVSVGQACGTDLYGARVKLHNTLPGVDMEVLPEALAQAVQELPSAPAFQSLEAAARERAAGRCEVSGVGEGADLPLVSVPELRFDLVARKVEVVGALCVCAPVAAAKRWDALPEGDERARALELARLLTGWSVADLEDYLGYLEARKYVLKVENFSLVV